ncbi:MAG: hypothetical protein Q4G63_04845 [Bacteroidia bacterium]|nr:hypothetical protein [Bacteroidia bacterium]
MLLTWLIRKKHAKGFGIHSPFAFNFITNVIYEKHGYTAFEDIEQILLNNDIETTEKKLHHLSYRLVRYFQPKKIFEFGAEKGVNTLYISAAFKNATLKCFDPAEGNTLMARNLHTVFNKDVEFIDKVDISESYDGIFVYPNTFSIDIESLLSMSVDDTFWVITGIKFGNGKRFWKNIVKDKRARLTFDMKDIGIVILKKSYHKKNYLI